MPYKIRTKYLTKNPYSRPGTRLTSIKGIVIHWIASPNGKADGVFNFWEARKNGKNSYGSAHEVIDLDGSILITLPENELAYHVGSSLPYKSGTKQVYTPLAWEKLNTTPGKQPYPNNCTYGIECTHIDWDGKMTTATYNTLVERCADLCKKWKLDPLTQLFTHQEVVGWKDCHRWFVNNPKEWTLFKQRVKEKMNPTAAKPAQPPSSMTKEELIMQLLQWQKEMGEKALDELVAKGLMNKENVADWKKKLGDHVPNWLFFEMLNRTAEKALKK